MSRIPRSLLAAGALALGFTLACSGVTDRVKGAIADQVEQAIAKNMGLDPGDVEVAALDSGRWSVDTPSWDADCGFAGTASVPEGFLFKTNRELIADCTVNASECSDVLGLPCGEDGADIGIAMQLYNDGQTGAAKLVNRRTKELEGLGFDVIARKDEKNKDATLLTARKGKRIRAVAMISKSDGGNAAEVLVAPLAR